MWLPTVVVVLMPAASNSHRCFSSPADFEPGAMRGRWAETDAHYADESGAVADDVVSAPRFNASGRSYTWRPVGEVAVGRVEYGNFQCPMEGYIHTCGSGLGSFAFDWHVAGLGEEWDRHMLPNGKWSLGIEERFPAWREMWLRNGRSGWRRRRWEPDTCQMPYLDGEALVRVLAGRRLRLIGDSTMRQVFTALVCMIPPELVAQYQPKWNQNRDRFKLDSMSRVELVSQGTITYEDGRLAPSLFFRGDPTDIVVQHADLHNGRVSAVVSALADALEVALQTDPAPLIAGPWRIYMHQSIQHFGKLETAQECVVDGAYTPEKFDKHTSCARCAEPKREVHDQQLRLSGLLAAVTNIFLRTAGAAHPTTFYADCTHFCQPGPPDAIATSLAAILTEYKDAADFFHRVTNSSHWREKRSAQPITVSST